MPSHVAGVLLAAGQGSRFGGPKALIELGGLTLAQRGVDLLRAGGADPVLVITGAAPVSVAGTRRSTKKSFFTTSSADVWPTSVSDPVTPRAVNSYRDSAIGAGIVSRAFPWASVTTLGFQ